MTLVLGAVILVLLEVVVARFDGSWIWIDRVLWHPLSVELAALALLITACWLGFRSTRLATAATAVAALIAPPVLVVTGALGTLGASAEPSERFPAPGGRWSAVVDHAAVHVMEDGSHIWIETNEGLRSRRWLAACLAADDPEDDFSAFTWENPQRARIVTVRGDVHTLEVDARTGRPRTRIDVGPTATEICGR